jgi:hypothetical protein
MSGNLLSCISDLLSGHTMSREVAPADTSWQRAVSDLRKIPTAAAAVMSGAADVSNHRCYIELQ